MLNAASLTDKEMQKIAHEMNLSETGFCSLQSQSPSPSSFFTLTNEVKFCEHATVGALCSIARENLFNGQIPCINFSVETKDGILPDLEKVSPDMRKTLNSLKNMGFQ